MLFNAKSDLSRPAASSSFLPAKIQRKFKRSLMLSSAVLMFACGGIAFAAELVNINAADVESIASSLTGVGPAKAQAIVDYREQFGAFLQIEDITNVPGIGDVTLEQIKSLITLGNTAQ